MSKQAKKVQHEYDRNYADSIDQTTVVFNKKPPVSSDAYKAHSKQVSQRGPKDPIEDGGIIARPEASVSFQNELQQARIARDNMKESDLAKLMNLKASVINEWESGRAVPNGKEKAQLGKVLGVRFSKSTKVVPTKASDRLG